MTITNAVRWRQLGALVFAAAVAFGAAAIPLAVRGADVSSDAASGSGSNPDEGDAVDVYPAEGPLGTLLTGPDGMTLYYYTRDIHTGESRCYGRCADAWPPLFVEDGFELIAEEGVNGTLSIAPRNDGTAMATHRGRPLYYFAGDDAPGDTRGQGLGDTWFVALTDGSSPADPAELTLLATSDGLGEYLTDGEGMTLYFFSADTIPGASECRGDCPDAWPPLTVQSLDGAAAGEGVTGVLGFVPRDGRVGVTYDGRPLYHFAGDQAPGDTNGHGRNDVWYVAAADGTLPTE